MSTTVGPGASSVPTLDEVAREAGVSRSTASRAINGGERVSPSAQAAVDDAVARLGFVPNRAARSLVTRRTGSVALVLPEPDERVLNDPFLTATLRGVSSALGSSDLQLILIMARPGEKEGRIARYLSSGHVDGVIVASHHREDGLEDALRTSSLPSVFVGRPFSPDGLTFIDMDNAGGARLAVRRMVERGCRRIATVTGPDDMTSGVDRLTGWRAAMAEAGLADDAVETGDFTLLGGAAAMERLLDEHPDIDGVFAASDMMAAGALRVLRERGRSVPDDVAVIGFDDLDMAADPAIALTTIHNDVSELVRLACDALLTTIEVGSATTPPPLPARLVSRSSG
ncbi:LacI family transcriptional regulator [Paraoerskovia sediminicola]|uniref:LacI family transcriptional regulator n=1 Tax=Paraoerskovia sediminicola TaxID=1138587 RepID=A0ABN6XCY8_9CELL|nr:LacI family DNA-binding transcriptional regulator [Paraoerskovia sediminicola]BDZ42817.1 LacI family transcriptional regulator [Paraoerskovia sediminicola]